MSGYNLIIEVNDHEFETGLRMSDDIAPLDAMKRAFWAVQNEFFGKDKKNDSDANEARILLSTAMGQIDKALDLINSFKRAMMEVNGRVELNLNDQEAKDLAADMEDLAYNMTKLAERIEATDSKK